MTGVQTCALPILDPHKRSATIEIIDDRQKVLSGGRFGTDRDGYKAMLAAGRKFKDRTRALEDDIRLYLATCNDNPHPFWVKAADEILASIERFCLRISGT